MTTCRRDPAQWLITNHPNRDRRAKNDREERRGPRRVAPPPTPSLFRVFALDCFAEVGPRRRRRRLSIPFRRQTRKKDGGEAEKVGETEAGPPWAGKKEGSYMWVKQEGKFLVLTFCHRCFLSKKSRRHWSQCARQTDSRLICQ